LFIIIIIIVKNDERTEARETKRAIWVFVTTVLGSFRHAGFTSTIGLLLVYWSSVTQMSPFVSNTVVLFDEFSGLSDSSSPRRQASGGSTLEHGCNCTPSFWLCRSDKKIVTV